MCLESPVCHHPGNHHLEHSGGKKDGLSEKKSQMSDKHSPEPIEMVREVEVKHQGEKKVQMSTCSSPGLDEMVRQAKGRELVNDSPNELQAVI